MFLVKDGVVGLLKGECQTQVTCLFEGASTPWQVPGQAQYPPLAELRIARQALYFVALTADVAVEAVVEPLANLLAAAPLAHAVLNQRLSTEPSAAPVSVLLLPRLGTTSPWSTQATSIAAVCGLQAVQRIEHGWILTFTDVAGVPLTLADPRVQAAQPYLYDRMTTIWCAQPEAWWPLFDEAKPKALTRVPLLRDGLPALAALNAQLGLALSDEEMHYLLTQYQQLGRDPTDAELMMFAQANSEHCRHKLFNAQWTLAGQPQAATLFNLIRSTHAKHPGRVLSAYHDNGAVLSGYSGQWWRADPETGQYGMDAVPQPVVIKVETHNHPTGIAPWPGAATGAGGEIRDGGAVGRGAKPKAGVAGYTVAHLHLPNAPQPWETDLSQPAHMAPARQIMQAGPLGAAAFNNEFGRPLVGGYFRSFELAVTGPEGPARRGFHKPIMISGGVGNMRVADIDKQPLAADMPVMVLGGPAMLIGLGGGAASSKSSADATAELDFASVQRSNPQMQRRCQEVIDACVALGSDNPIVSIHDVGAGGLANALPELIHDGGVGGRFDLRNIPNAEPGLSPLEIWCNEAQERYVLALDPARLAQFLALCEREACPVAQVGVATAEPQLVVEDSTLGQTVVDLPLALLLDHSPKTAQSAPAFVPAVAPFQPEVLGLIDAEGQAVNLQAAALRILQHPTVGDKSFLLTIADRSVGGRVARDPMVGPWQVPVADVGVTLNTDVGYTGEAVAMGERPPVALLDPAAAARLAMGEVVTNLAAARIDKVSDISFSANWMAAAAEPGEAAALYAAVQTVAEDICPALGCCIPVGKDSLSMTAAWQVGDKAHKVSAPVTLVATGFAPVLDARKTLTPELQALAEPTLLLCVDLTQGEHHLGGSILAEVYGGLGEQPADVENPADLAAFFSAMQRLHAQDYALAYHDRSDGGLWVTLCEMAFASRCGLNIQLAALPANPLGALFHEGLGAVLQIRSADLAAVQAIWAGVGLAERVYTIAYMPPHLARDTQEIVVYHGQQQVLRGSRKTFQQAWASTSLAIQALRDAPFCAPATNVCLADDADPGLGVRLPKGWVWPTAMPVATPATAAEKPRVAILREQGVNGHLEMAFAFYQAGFTCVDVTMNDLASRTQNLADFVGLAVCGGFSYGDVLGSGRGWAQRILLDTVLQQQFADFFARPDTFTLGVCNGCQMLAHLKALIPGAEHWPLFTHNHSQRFESRLLNVKVTQSPSLFFADMQDVILPVVVAHGEGRAVFQSAEDQAALWAAEQVCLQYVDHRGSVTTEYPFNPNGSAEGLTAFTSQDGRVTIAMPHPERVIRTVQCSWHPKEWGEYTPWQRFFINARRWVNNA